MHALVYVWICVLFFCLHCKLIFNFCHLKEILSRMFPSILQGFQSNLSIFKRSIQRVVIWSSNRFLPICSPFKTTWHFNYWNPPPAKFSAADQHTARPSAPWASAAAAATRPRSTSPIPPATVGRVPKTAKAQRSGAVGGWATKRAAWVVVFWGPNMYKPMRI